MLASFEMPEMKQFEKMNGFISMCASMLNFTVEHLRDSFLLLDR